MTRKYPSNRLKLSIWAGVLITAMVAELFIGGLLMLPPGIVKLMFWGSLIASWILMRLNKINIEYIILFIVSTIIVWNVLPFGKIYLYGCKMIVERDGYLDGLIRQDLISAQQASTQQIAASRESESFTEFPQIRHFNYDGRYIRVDDYGDSIHYHVIVGGTFFNNTVIVHQKMNLKKPSWWAPAISMSREGYYMTCGWEARE